VFSAGSDAGTQPVLSWPVLILDSMRTSVTWTFSGIRLAPVAVTILIGVVGSTIPQAKPYLADLSWQIPAVWLVGSLLGYYLALARPWQLYSAVLKEVGEREATLASLSNDRPP
jgi:hypothetical protein